MDDREQRFRRDAWRDLDSGYTISGELAVGVGVWMGLGWLTDRWLGTDPWLMVVGAVLGFVLTMYVIYKRVEAQAALDDAARERL